MNQKKMLVNGELRCGAESFAVTNPFTGESIAEVGAADRAQMDEVAAAAERAAGKMRALSRFELAKGLRKIAEEIENRSEEFAKTISVEAAKPISIAKGEVERAIATFAWAAGEAERFAGEAVPIDTQAMGKNRTAYT